jgi:tetratricopeptide (TPR) repeat protein
MVLAAALGAGLGPGVSLMSEEPSRASPTSSAALLVAQGKEREAAGDELTALKRYGDALALDPTSDEAYLALGNLRTKRGELAEAEQVYGTALTRLPGSVVIVLARARVRRLAGKLPDAADDLARARVAIGNDGSKLERELLVETITLKRLQGEPAAQLAAWRRLLAIARHDGDATAIKEASIQARALGMYMGEVDPALLGRRDPDAVRKALAAIAKRQ